MAWFGNAFWAYFGWIGANVVLLIGVFVLMALLSIPRWMKQSLCKHLQFHETMSCNAICSDCGKNLGFIGTWREKLRQQ